MDEKLKKDIEDVVTSIFSEKEQADQRNATQAALNESAETISALTTTLNDKSEEFNTTVASLKDEVKGKEVEIANLVSELEAAKNELEETKTTLSTTEANLESIKKDNLATARMAELEEAKVAMVNDLKSQALKVREMGDDEFATYKNDRIELRNSVMKELEEAQKNVAPVVADEAEVDGVKVEAAADEKPEVNTPPAKIAPGQAMAAAMNFEHNPTEDVLKKYAALGKAMASSMTADKSK